MSEFKKRVIKAVEQVPYGKVASYGQIALMVGVPRAAIQVGGVLNKLEGKYSLPWWRIINNKGRITIKGSKYNALEQKELLQKEDIVVTKDLTLDIEKYRYRPTPDELQKLSLDDDYIQQLIDKYLL
jgi:methylated-DNA-protein-cysteine methyltransferase-like protein